MYSIIILLYVLVPLEIISMTQIIAWQFVMKVNNINKEAKLVPVEVLTNSTIQTFVWQRVKWRKIIQTEVMYVDALINIHSMTLITVNPPVLILASHNLTEVKLVLVHINKISMIQISAILLVNWTDLIHLVKSPSDPLVARVLTDKHLMILIGVYKLAQRAKLIQLDIQHLKTELLHVLVVIKRLSTTLISV